jgi:hypothetical protein
MRAAGAEAPGDEPPAAAVGKAIPGLKELIVVAHDTTRGSLEAEEALGGVRERCQDAEDEDTQAELAAQALRHVERQLKLTRERRRQLDSVEGKLWARRNRLERFLIHTRGSDWWHARADLTQPDA